MMDDAINPYTAPTSTEDSPDETDLRDPVMFSGCWQSHDYLAALRNLDPSQVMQTVMGILSIPLMIALVVIAARDSFAFGSVSEPPPFIWLMLTLIVTPLCWGVWIVWGKHARLQRHRARQKGNAECDTPKIGWADEKGVSIRSATSAYRAEWELFSQPLLFRHHTVLPISFNTSQRLVIPHRLFSSPWDCHRVRSFIQRKWHMQKSSQPKMDDLKKVEFTQNDTAFSPTDQSSRHAHQDMSQPDATQRWNEVDWPLEKQPGTIHEFEIVDSVGPAVPSMWAVASGLTIFLAPVQGMLVLWLAWERNRFGSWSFLSWRWGENLWMQFPVLTVTIGALWMLWSQIRLTKKASREPIQLRVTDAGIHFKRPSLETWNDWSEITRSITENDRAGWVVKPLDDEVAYSKKAFRSDTEFNLFKSILFKYTEPSNAQPV